MSTLEVERTVLRLADFLTPVGENLTECIHLPLIPDTATEADMNCRDDGGPKFFLALSYH